ncbi:hypothetical protein TCSYLVIO_000610, partial [Trypanosoma cruzi]
DVNVPPITQNNTSSPRNFALSARRFARVRPAAFHRNAESRRKPAAHQRVHPSSASRPPAPPLHCAAFYKRTQAGEKRTAASPTSRELCATGVVPPARRIGDGASVTARTLHTPGATPPALTAAAPWDAPFTNKSHEHTRIHSQRLPTASTHREVRAQAREGRSKQRTHKKMLNPLHFPIAQLKQNNLLGRWPDHELLNNRKQTDTNNKG